MYQSALRCATSLIPQMLYGQYKKLIEESDVVLSLGGDNYSLDYGNPERFLAIGRYVKSLGKPFVIWGASIGPFNRRTESRMMMEHFRHDVDLICVRERESLDYLRSNGLNDKLVLMMDSAFSMAPESVSLSLPARYLAANFSSLMAKFVTGGDLSEWIKICREMCKVLHEKMNLPIVLVPHVDSDWDFMNENLRDLFREYNINLLRKSYNAAQLKWIISKSELLIACRTHATIAGFSSSVPTISLGYSIKAKGLNHLVYGHEKYMLYKDKIAADGLDKCVDSVLDHFDDVRESLKKFNIYVSEKNEELLNGIRKLCS